MLPLNTIEEEMNQVCRGTIEELQEKYAKHCGYKTFEELREKDEEALRVWYLNMI